MRGVREFIIGFSFSLASVSLGGQLYYFPASANNTNKYSHVTKINLFKDTSSLQKQIEPTNIFADIKHHSLIKEAATSIKKETIKSDTQAIQPINAPDDDEILSINIDGTIPIEYDSDAVSSQHAEILHYEDENISAMLPTDISDDVEFQEDTPWAVAKGSRHIKNKQLLQDMESKDIASDLENNFTLTLEENKEDSYRVAEKIKSSLLFPIPDEILNDENLTPTFIKKDSKKSKNTTNSKTDTKKIPSTTQKEELKIIQQQSSEQVSKAENSKSFLNNISSWFVPTAEKVKEPAKTKSAPSYSSQELSQSAASAAPSSNNEFVNFYKTLQETSIAHQNNSIIPSELKLSFQPERAEISGQTLRWLKAFSEAAKNDDTYLQVRLDVSASTELQRKRLNLLYTIFMNNGVDFQKIDTVFSLTEPNAFIIRTLKVK